MYQQNTLTPLHNTTHLKTSKPNSKILSYHSPHSAAYTMDAKAKYKQQQKKKMSRNRSARMSFSANLPSDVCGVWADNAMCAVLYTEDPLDDVKQSIVEMVREVGVCNWGEMEELIYCYIALNSSEVHRFIQDAFLSLFS